MQFFSLTDEQAMLRVQKRSDSRAFALLVRRWETPIQRLCTRMVGDAHRGEDLAQDTFVRLFSCRGGYRGTGKFGTYIRRIALNLCYDELRRMKRRGELPLECGEDQGFAAVGCLMAPEPSPEHQLVQQEQAEWVRNALSRLSEPYRSVVVLRHYEGMKFREIAEVLEVPEGTVKSRMAEALTQLSRILKPISTEG